LHLLLLNSNESGMNVIWSYFIVCYTVEDSFIVGKKLAPDKKWGTQKLESLGLYKVGARA